MRRRRRRYNRSNPLPPCLPVLARQNAFLQSKTPLFMTCLVLCYWQPTEAQPLARVGQTRGEGMVRLMVGGPRLTGWNELPSASCGAAVSARGRCLCREGRNAFTSCTNYFPHLIATHLHLLTQLTCISPLTPSRHHVPRSRHPCIRRAPRTHRACTLFFACRFFFVAIISRNARFALVSPTSTNLIT